MAKVAIVDKCPSGNRYQDLFEFDIDTYHLSSTKQQKVLKRDIDLDLSELDNYEFIITVGAEPTKFLAKTTVTSYQGYLVDNKYLPLINPAMAKIKPEVVPAFEKAVADIHNYVYGTVKAKSAYDIKGIQTTEKAVEYLNKVLDLINREEVTEVAVDTETSALNPRDGYVLGISMSHTLNQGVYIDADCIDEVVESLMQEIFNKVLVVFHNAKFDMKMLQYHFGFKFPRFTDTMLLHYLLDERTGTHGLKDLAMKFTDLGDYDRELEEFKRSYCKRTGVKISDFTYDLIPFDIMWFYAGCDTAATIALYYKFWPKIRDSVPLFKAYTQLIIPGTLFLLKIEENGVPFNLDELLNAQKELSAQIFELEAKIYEFDEVHQFEKSTRTKFNPNSVYHLRNLLFDIVGLPPTGNKTGNRADSTDAESLAILAEQHELPKLLLSIRKLKKIKSTYIDKIIPNLDRDSRLRTGFHMHTTTSGRLSSSGKLNMQQLPRDNKIVKHCIQAREGYVIVSQDLATAEMYIAAVLSGDKKLQKVFIDVANGNGADFHSTIAHMVFKLPCEAKEVKELYPTQRQAAKAVSFGIMYGSGPDKVATTAGISLEEAKETITTYFKTFFRLKKWLADTQQSIKDKAHVYSIFGRKRRLPNVDSPDNKLASHTVRSGVNFLVQSVASDVNLFAAIDMQDYIEQSGIDAKIFGLVHDSILAEVKIEDLENYLEKIAYYTQKDRGCSIPGCPIGIDQEIGSSYAFKDGEEYGRAA